MAKFGDGAKTSRVRVALPDEPSQRFIKRTGVVLQRGTHMEGNVTALIFFKGSGLIWVYIAGAAKGSRRFGGALEPLVWGHYQLYQSKSRRTYIKEIEVTDDFWSLRTKPKAIIEAVQWTKLFKHHLILGFPYDDLLALFYWGLKALDAGVTPAVVTARLLWRWQYVWGIAPDLTACSECGRPLDEHAHWNENSFICDRCAGTSSNSMDITEFTEYAFSRTFMLKNESDALKRQAIKIKSLLLENLEHYK